MLEILICEDHAPQREFLAKFIKEYCAHKGLPAELVMATESPNVVLQNRNFKENAQLYFLDIDLNTEMNGIELARKLRDMAAPDEKLFIAFTTGRMELTMLTFQYQVEAMDFISKAHSGELKTRVVKCIQTALARSGTEKPMAILDIVVREQPMKVIIDEIIYIETTHIRHKLRLYTENRILEFKGELKDIEQKLGSDFIRSHRSFLVNKHKIVSINKKESTLTMTNQNSCPISRNAKKMFV